MKFKIKSLSSNSVADHILLMTKCCLAACFFFKTDESSRYMLRLKLTVLMEAAAQQSTQQTL
jgi:hypothetical protein